MDFPGKSLFSVTFQGPVGSPRKSKVAPLVSQLLARAGLAWLGLLGLGLAGFS